MESQPQTPKSILRKKSKSRIAILPDFKQKNKAVSIKAI